METNHRTGNITPSFQRKVYYFKENSKEELKGISFCYNVY